MRIRLSICAALAATTVLSACTSYRGTNRLHLTTDAPSARTADYFGIRTMFKADLEASLAMRGGLYADGRSVPPAIHKAQMRRLLNSGFSLARLYCNEYFNEMGRNQRNSAILRDLVKPVTDVVNMVIGLKLLSNKENVNADLVTGFAGLSSAGVAGLNVYDRHFLFDHDNISAVRTMTMNGLAKHREEVYKNAPEDVVLAVGQLQENENICTPAQILSNVRDAIKKGEFTAKTTGAGDGGSGAAPPPPPPPPPPAGQGIIDQNQDAVPAGSENVAVSPGA